jgi:apolipoprotein D and lipocalin family protein
MRLTRPFREYFMILPFLGVMMIPALAGQKAAPPVTVGSVDLQRYLGVWYEIAKIPNSFQKMCASGTTATYSLLPDGRLMVVNRCVDAEGKAHEARGLAKVVDTATNAKLKVSFVRILGLSLFWGDYWIIGLDENYRWAVVGHPNRKYGWILAREQALDKADLERINALLREKGYDPEAFEPTEQKNDQ